MFNTRLTLRPAASRTRSSTRRLSRWVSVRVTPFTLSRLPSASIRPLETLSSVRRRNHADSVDEAAGRPRRNASGFQWESQGVV